MRYHALGVAILLSNQQVYAKQDTILLPIIQVQAEDQIFVDNEVKIKNSQADNKTLGDALKHISGIQSSAFGPNAGAPVIRSLSGHRVKTLEDSLSLYGMNAISGNIDISFDSLFYQSIDVNKSSDSVRHGGNAIGGSVNIDSGIISTKLPDKNASLEVVVKKGWDDLDAQGFKVNLNNQNNFSTNFQFSWQDITAYKIPGHSKAELCNSALFPNTGGTNTALADACQKDARIQQVYNTASQPYIDQFITNNPDWADGTFSFYNDQPTSIWGGKTYINPENPNYIPNTPKYTQNKINKDVTPDYYRKLGNSYLENQNYAIGSTYFVDNGYIGFSADIKESEYGVPGFSLENKSFQSSYDNGIPVGVKTKQNKYTLDSQFNYNSPLLNQIQFRANRVINTSGEYLAQKVANNYKFNTQQAELIFKHQPVERWRGLIGIYYNDRDIKGDGDLRYLPDLNSENHAIFIKEKIDFGWLEFDAGYRNEQIKYNLKSSDFKTSRNSANIQLEDRKFTLDHFNVGSYLKFNDLIGLKLRYSESERAPDINELYASGYHYSIMVQEEGNQNLKQEKSKNLEIMGLLNYKDFNLQATAYKMEYDNYLYLTHSGMQTANRLPLKYWTQTDTEITGFEIDLSNRFDIGYYGSLVISGFADLVKNKNLNPSNTSLFNDGNFLPNMPTNRYGAHILWEKNDWVTTLSSIYYDQPKYLGKNVSVEVPLPAYTLLDMQLRRSIKLHNTDLDLFLNGSNLLNEDARPQNSPLKYIAPMPGRSFQVGITLKL